MIQLSFQSIKSEDKEHQNSFRVVPGSSSSWKLLEVKVGGRRLKELYPCKGMFNLEAAARTKVGEGEGEAAENHPIFIQRLPGALLEFPSHSSPPLFPVSLGSFPFCLSHYLPFFGLKTRAWKESLKTWNKPAFFFHVDSTWVFCCLKLEPELFRSKRSQKCKWAFCLELINAGLGCQKPPSCLTWDSQDR